MNSEYFKILPVLIGVIASISVFILTRNLKEYRYSNLKKSLFLSIISIITVIATILLSIQEKPFDQTTDLTEKIQQLDNIKSSFNELETFIDEQEKYLKETQAEIEKMKKEKSEIAPLLEADKEVVDAMIKQLRKNRWIEWIIAFFIGIISSLSATSIYRVIVNRNQSKRKKPIRQVAEKTANIIFKENFSEFLDWQDFKKGTIAISNEIKTISNNQCLKKLGNNDPNGGFKLMDKTVDYPFVFSGYIFRPSVFKGGKADRIAIENEQFNGYGFCCNHSNKMVFLEKRIDGDPSQIGDKKTVNEIKTDCWYKFELKFNENNLHLKLKNLENETIHQLETEIDEEINNFDRVVVHGGHQYFIDELEVKKI